MRGLSTKASLRQQTGGKLDSVILAEANLRAFALTIFGMDGAQSAFLDALTAIQLIGASTWRRNLRSWVYVPIGLNLILLACFAVNGLIGLGQVSFPASVACMIFLFFALIACNSCFGDKRTRQVVNVIDVPAGFALRYINIFFTPSFVLLPLSPPISGHEVGKIIAVFILGFLVMVLVTAYMVRGLQLILGSSKRAITERAEEMGPEDDEIPLTETNQSGRESQNSEINSHAIQSNHSPTSGSRHDSTSYPIAPERAQDPNEIRGSGGPPVGEFTVQDQVRTRNIQQAPLPLTRPQIWAAQSSANLDRITYSILFLFVGLPIYYITGYAMPAQLTFNILAYFVALALPKRWRQFLHPVLVSSAITVLIIWILGLIRGDGLTDVLAAYKTNTKYLQLWKGKKGLAAPGAGDIFGSILDASIVALALPMFQYRKELKQHFFAIVIPNLVISVGSLFGYPALCYAIGISSKRSLAFGARSLTLALATPAVSNIEGDLNTVAALCIMSGILGVLIGPRVLQWLQIPEDDYVTRGVTLGANSSAIATALLLISDPRAAALSSLSMSLFGTITVALTSVPPIAHAIKGLVGL